MTSPHVAELLGRVQFGDPSAARQEAEDLLATGAAMTDDATMLRMVVALGCMIEEGPRAALELLQRRLDALVPAAEETVLEQGFLTGLRAHMLILLDRTPEALEDLIEVEAILASQDRSRHSVRMLCMNLGVAYGFLDLYPLAEDHLAPLIEPHDGPWRTADQMLCYVNLSELNLRWAQELERAGLADDEAGSAEHLARLDAAQRHCDAGLALLEPGAGEEMAAWGSALQRVFVQLLAYRRPGAAVGAARSELAVDLSRGSHGLAAAMATSLSQALRRSGDHTAALEAAIHAVELSDAADRGTVLHAAFQRHLASMALGHEGSTHADHALRTANLTIWRQREQDVEHIRRRRELSMLEERHNDLMVEARQDPLTGVGNRRALDEWLQAHSVGPASAFVIDLDGFKAVNDLHGHDLGDLVLQAVADALRDVTRQGDLVVRAGGDEFVIVCEGPTPDPSDHVLRLDGALATCAVDGVLPPGSIRGSIGFAVAASGTPTDHLVRDADQMMFQRKRRAGLPV